MKAILISAGQTFALLVLATAAQAGKTGDAAGGDIFVGFAFLGLMFVAYLFPAFVAMARGHGNTLAISMLNLLLGWTVLGWIISLVWACTNNRRVRAEA